MNYLELLKVLMPLIVLWYMRGKSHKKMKLKFSIGLVLLAAAALVDFSLNQVVGLALGESIALGTLAQNLSLFLTVAGWITIVSAVTHID